MKNLKNIFLSDLKKQKFVNEKYRKEIEDELNDHFEDLKYDLICSGLNETEAEKEALKRIGSPTRIVNTLNYYMKDSRFYTLFETLVFSIITLPFYHILFMANADLLFPSYNDPNGGFNYYNLYRAIIGTIIGIMPIILITKHLAKNWIYNLLLKKELLINSLFYIFPIILFHMFFYKNFVGYELRLGNYLHKEILHLITIIILNLGLIKFWYRRLEIKKLIKKQNSNITKITKKLIGISACIYMFVLLILNFLSFTQNEHIFYLLGEKINELFHKIFFIKFMFDFLQRFILMIVFGQSSGILAFWCLGFVYIAILILCLINLYKYYKSKYQADFPYFHLAGIFYIISVLILAPVYKQNIDWQVPVDHISEKIEKRQMFIFYNMSQYMNDDEGRLFHYNISYKNNTFNLNQSGSDYLFQISDIKNIYNYKMNKFKENFPGDAWPNDIPDEISKNLKCVSYPKDLSAKQVIIEGENQWLCSELWYKEKLVYIQKQDWPHSVLEIEVDEKEEFMLLNISNGAYDPTDVYLVSLK